MVYTLPKYVPLIAIAIAAIAVAIGVYMLLRRKRTLPAAIAFAVAALAGVILAPMLAMDRVVLDGEKLEQTTGFWFAPTVKGFRLDDVDFITIGTARDSQGRRYQAWFVTRKDGHILEIDPGDLWEMNGQDIVERLRAGGIEVRL